MKCQVFFFFSHKSNSVRLSHYFKSIMNQEFSKQYKSSVVTIYIASKQDFRQLQTLFSPSNKYQNANLLILRFQNTPKVLKTKLCKRYLNSKTSVTIALYMGLKKEFFYIFKEQLKGLFKETS